MASEEINTVLQKKKFKKFILKQMIMNYFNVKDDFFSNIGGNICEKME